MFVAGSAAVVAAAAAAGGGGLVACAHATLSSGVPRQLQPGRGLRRNFAACAERAGRLQGKACHMSHVTLHTSHVTQVTVFAYGQTGSGKTCASPTAASLYPSLYNRILL